MPVDSTRSESSRDLVFAGGGPSLGRAASPGCEQPASTKAMRQEKVANWKEEEVIPAS